MAFFSLQDLGLLASSSSLIQDWLAEMQTQYPGYAPSAGNLEYVQAQVFATQLAALAQLASSGGTELFRTYGTTLLGIPYQQGVAAQAVINVTAVAPGQLSTLSGPLSTGGPIGSLPVIQLTDAVAAGTITVDDGSGHTQTWTTTGTAAGATSVPVSSQTPNFAYPSASTVTGAAAYSLSALTQFTLDSLGFYNLTPYTIDSGASQQVTVTAVQNGALFNGAGSQGALSSVQQLSWIQTMTVLAVAANGLDPEDDLHYLNRLTQRTQLMAPRPITATDYGLLSPSFTPQPGTDQQEVSRATAIDGYNPSDGSTGNQRMVTVAVTDSNGIALNSDTMYGYPNGTALSPVLTPPSQVSGCGVQGWLTAFRELNFIVNVISPTYSTVWVTVTVKAAAGWDVVSVRGSVQAALLAYLSPSSWGLPPNNGSGWINSTTLYYSAVSSVIQNAAGVDHVVAGTLALGFAANPGTLGDLALPQPVALPTSNATSIPTSAITVV